MQCCCQNTGEEPEENNMQPRFDADVSSGGNRQGVSGGQQSRSLEDQSLIPQLPIDDEKLSQCATMRLEVLDSPSLTKGQVFTLNAQGLVGSTRQSKDGRIIIGCNRGSRQVNDIDLPNDGPGIGEQHLIIQYNQLANSYVMKDQGQGSGTFIKLIQPVSVKKGYIISFGDSHMVIDFTVDGQRMILSFLEGPKQGESFEFGAEDSPIQIGRLPECKIYFEDDSLSRRQCKLWVDPGLGWVVCDGDGKKASTNGTWFFIEDLYGVYDNMIFKAGLTLFKVSISGKEQ